MTRRDEVIRMAREAGFDASFGSDGKPFFGDKLLRKIERFAALVAAEKQEQCASIAYAARDGFVGKSNKMACAADFILHEIRALKDGEE